MKRRNKILAGVLMGVLLSGTLGNRAYAAGGVSTANAKNSIVWSSGAQAQTKSTDTHYNGQDNKAYGYGGIYNISSYISSRYGGDSNRKTAGKSLSMSTVTCARWNNKSNCTIVAITRVIYYYRCNGYDKIDASIDSIYQEVLKVAKTYGYTEEKGTFPTKINNIIDKVLDEYGYPNASSKGIYVWTYEKQVCQEINASRPVIMNIARGYYADHTVTVCGYADYESIHQENSKTTIKKHHFIQVYDGWTTGKRYIDYDAFAYDSVVSGIGSFNTVVMK